MFASVGSFFSRQHQLGWEGTLSFWQAGWRFLILGTAFAICLVTLLSVAMEYTSVGAAMVERMGALVYFYQLYAYVVLWQCAVSVRFRVVFWMVRAFLLFLTVSTVNVALIQLHWVEVGPLMS